MNTKHFLIAGLLLLSAIPVISFGASFLFSVTPPLVNWKKEAIQQLTLTKNVTLTFKNGEPGGEYALIVRQDTSGGRIITWPSNVTWAGGVAPILTATPLGTDVVRFLFDGSQYLGTFDLNFSNVSPQPSTLGDSLTHYWKLNESSGSAMDSVGGMHLIDKGNATFVTGKLLNALDVENTSATSIIATATDLFSSTPTKYSISFWVKPESQPTNNTINYIALVQEPGYQIFWGYADDGGVKQLYWRQFNGSNSSNIVTHNVTLNNNTFYFLTFVWDGTAMHMYLNGSLVATSPYSLLGGDGNNIGFGIGGSEDGNVYWDGLVDEVGVWTRDLSAVEVTQLYNAGSGISYPF